MRINNIEYDTVMAIDPGVNGAIVVMRNNTVKSAYMPSKIGHLTDYFKYYATISDRVFCAIERQSLWTGDLNVKLDQENDEDYREILEKMMQRNREQAAKVYRLQKLFENYTHLKMMVEQNRMDFLPISPISWQSKLGLVNRDSEETGTEKKNRHKENAQAHFQTVQVTHRNADALLILFFIHHVSNNDPGWFVRGGKCKIEYADKSIIN